MSTALQISHIRIKTDEGWQEPYDLDHQVVAVIGPVDTGKSSMLDCIAFALGKDIDAFRGAVHLKLREVEIGIRVASGKYTLRRARRTSSYIEVFDSAGTFEGRLAVKRTEEQSTISDWLLSLLKLDDIFGAVRELDFSTSLLPYCYLSQADIDSHIIRPEREKEQRLVVARLLFNLTTPGYERTVGLIKDTDNEIKNRLRRARTISNFLTESRTTDPNVIKDKILTLRARQLQAANRLADWRNDARAATKFADEIRHQLRLAREEVSEAEMVLDKARRYYDKARANVVAIDEALDALSALEERTGDLQPTLHGVISTCPACKSSLAHRVPLPGHCYVCAQILPGTVHVDERENLLRARQEAKFEEAAKRNIVEESNERVVAAQQVLRGIQDALDESAGDTLAPFVDAISKAAAELAGVNSELASLSRIEDAFHRLDEQYKYISELEDKQKKQRENLAQEEGELESSKNVLEDLNLIFRRIIRGIDLPHATGRARLDEESLLPLVDEQTFDQRGGGARSAVAIAYSLTLLTYTLENSLAKLPSLLMIDSPQKNFGANDDDKALAHRVYERFLDAMAQRAAMGDLRFNRPFQLIIVDNDIHEDIARRVKVHSFDRINGFIRNLVDPHGQANQDDQLALDDM